MHWNLVILLAFNIIMSIRISNAKDFKPMDITTPATPTTLQRTTIAEGFSSETGKEGLAKRNIKVSDLSAANSVNSKTYDPPPEFYRWVEISRNGSEIKLHTIISFDIS